MNFERCTHCGQEIKETPLALTRTIAEMMRRFVNYRESVGDTMRIQNQSSIDIDLMECVEASRKLLAMMEAKKEEPHEQT